MTKGMLCLIDTQSEREHLEEQRRVDRVMALIRARIEGLERRLGHVREDVVDIRKNFWDDVTVNIEDSDDQSETYASLKQQAELLSERERSHRQARSEYIKLRRLRHSPYFGRIDFRGGEEAKEERIYIGLGSLLDENDDQFLIFDWRAPISSLYYDYGPGPAEYETPSGVITGTMERKRQYLIRDGKLRSMFDTGLTIGDELLQEVLGQGADAQMRNIVATIQREQNRIIRNDNRRMLIVTGPAGSGKTSAALQRVAYLLYKHRQMLTADQIVLFSPNPMFNRYVATVLPELGEENMEQTTYQEYMEQRLAKRFRLEDPFAQMEYVLISDREEGYAARLAGIAFKSSSDYLAVIREYVRTLEAEGLRFKPIKLRGRTLVSAEQLSARFLASDSTGRLSSRIASLVEWLEEELEGHITAERGRAWVQNEIELLEPEDYHRVYRQLNKESRQGQGAFNERQRESELLRDLVVRRAFRRLRAGVRRLRFIDLSAVYRQLFAETGKVPELAARCGLPASAVPERWPEVCVQTVVRLDAGELAYEDATPFLYLQEMVEGFRVNMNIRHLFVDEAQDYTPFQYEFLRKLFPRARMTALGDLNQAIFAHASALPGFDTLSGLYGEEASETIRLSRTYRSTRPIVEFTRQMIPGGESIEPFNRGGEKPTVTVAADANDLVARLAERLTALSAAGHRTLAVIAKTARESRFAYEALQSLAPELPLRLITQETAAFETGVAVIPSYLAKGIEFDAVLIFDASRHVYGRELERKLFYTACTRAMHELHLFSAGELSPFVAETDPLTYNRLS